MAQNRHCVYKVAQYFRDIVIVLGSNVARSTQRKD